MLLTVLWLVSSLIPATCLSTISRQLAEPQSWLSRRSPGLPRLDPAGPPVEWETSREHGWVGSKTSPNRGESSPASPPSREPTELRIQGTGPATLHVFKGKQPDMKIYKIKPDKAFNKKITDPDKIRVEGYPYREQSPDKKTGQIEFTGIGAKSFTRVQGHGGLGGADHAGGFDPGQKMNRGKRKAWSVPDGNRTTRPPPGKGGEPDTPSDPETTTFMDVESIKRTSKGRPGRAMTTGSVEGQGREAMLTTMVTNSPDHSPPRSPARERSKELFDKKARFHAWRRD